MSDYTANIAPFIDVIFYVTGEYGEIRPYETHVGLDIATSSPENLYSILDGVVINKDYSPLRGNYIVVKGDNNYAFLYQHMQDPSPLNIGDRVQIGQFVGVEGTTGQVTGLHLHIEMQYLENRNWNYSNDISYYINPAEYMGFPNTSGISVYYDGTPIFPKKNYKKWLELKNKRIIIKI